MVCMTQRLDTYSAVLCVSTDRLDKRSELSMSSSLIACNECGCVTLQGIFEGEVNFLQLKLKIIQGWEVQSFGAHWTLYARGLLCIAKKTSG